MTAELFEEAAEEFAGRAEAGSGVWIQRRAELQAAFLRWFGPE
jgi:hypothetical protein